MADYIFRVSRTAQIEPARSLERTYRAATVSPAMGSLVKKRRKRMRKKKHKKMLRKTRFQRRRAGK
jgi:hypothetical protein